MNREFKFRAWSCRMKAMSQVFRLGDDFTNFNPGNIWLSEIKRCPDIYPVMQFTGLHDKDGKEIYEGDIIYLAGYGDYIAEFPFCELYNAGAENDIGSVKGNIHENPELLEA